MDYKAGGMWITVNIPTQAALLAEIARRFGSGHGFALATLNLDHLAKMKRDSAFRKAYGAQDLVVADGNPIVWLARLGGRPVDLIPGSELIWPLLGLAADHGIRVGLLGSTEAVLAAAARHLTAGLPGLEVALTIAPPMGFDPEGPGAVAALKAMEAAGVRLCLLALGAPKQERLAALGRKETPDLGFASIGAGLDFIAGTQRRAPPWMREIAMEWLWRLMWDPKRLARRYVQSALVLPGHCLRALHDRIFRFPPRPPRVNSGS